MDLYWRVLLKNNQGPISQFVLPKNFVCKVILACHNDNGHLGMERTLRSATKEVLLAKNGERCAHTYAHVINA